jgi:acyl-CoA thioester hydrolase
MVSNISYETKLKVRFCEVDSYRVAWHGHYITWFEVSRNDFTSHFGLGPEDLRGMGLMAPVVDLRCSFKLPAKFGDEVLIQTTMQRCETAKLIFKYRVVRGEEVLAEGSTTHVLTDLRGMMLYQLPAEVKKRLEQMMGHLGV